MAIVDVRIDDRLIHGQVCGFWIPHFSVERIAIVDDVIVHDEARKTALKFGCPGKVKLSIFSPEAAADKFIRKIDKGINVMILCNRPEPILKMVEAGYQIGEVTVGNMSTKDKAKQIKKTVFVDEAEEKDFASLVKHGVKIFSQMVPNEQREDITADFK
ncbi:PTS system mannose-specific IIB component [Breznakia sp. PF5-3]|uniref:PTS system mannose/fructose/N-acetylgalactosamine-transporter subunit IIB n=1 Tax=unclassified Breznakia TaxID=2623764 RepID=UPI002404C5CF|nr:MULTISPECIES: PTS sugar transporter subunit IIB [unclassified Breznakia]MDL2276490.1 PTS sugar transporter subunit IIB [Breznakia sp. OttesenSCG-928-G09]MDF9824250.1 PTS system mannose-specific IIB component [Breznakia sp. PM6-1]MDF9835183.1 PTS system mannose-specific IIB component [Breznakia sp. PF5-3]MDF9837295.1 PTS system mannose-specific IIB component [Breznakia sp. PFB2-8]MDF9859430.1 PTS system mannose-specific IIB component [Breznakia sp. PH5-24]